MIIFSISNKKGIPQTYCLASLHVRPRLIKARWLTGSLPCVCSQGSLQDYYTGLRGKSGLHVLFYSVLYNSLLYCTVLYCSVNYTTQLDCMYQLFCNLLFMTFLYCILLLSIHYSTLLDCMYQFILSFTILYCTVVYCKVYTKLHYCTMCTSLFCTLQNCILL